MTESIFLLVAYLIGSIPFAIVSSRVFRLADPRSYGSGNPGATNVLRSGNKKAAILTLLGDAFKGWLAVWLAAHFAPPAGAASWIAPLCGLAAFIGHLFPVTLGFKGGKGVATALGVLAGLAGTLALATLVVWLAVAFISRYSSAAALSAALAAPPLTHWLVGSPAATAVVIVMSVLLVWKHKDNLKRLLAGTESRIGAKKG